jgi:hypothetical protein
MARRYDDPVDVRRRDEVPVEFLWRGRLYVVRDVLVALVETGAWWRAAGVRSAYAGDAGEAGDAGSVVTRGRCRRARCRARPGRARAVAGGGGRRPGERHRECSTCASTGAPACGPSRRRWTEVAAMTLPVRPPVSTAGLGLLDDARRSLGEAGRHDRPRRALRHGPPGGAAGRGCGPRDPGPAGPAAARPPRRLVAARRGGSRAGGVGPRSSPPAPASGRLPKPVSPAR